MTGGVLRLPQHRDTTRELGVLFPWQTSANLGVEGVCLGADVGAGSSWHYDGFSLYSQGLVTNANMIVGGEPGSGKSAAVKTMLYRTLGLAGTAGRQRRWAAILDPKNEYGKLGDTLGMTRLSLYPGGPHRINPLDPGPGAGPADREELVRNRVELVTALLSVMLDRPLNQVEDAVVGWSLELVGDRNARPSLHDVAQLLAEQPVELVGRLASMGGATGYGGDVRDVRLALDKLLNRDLRGLFDATSSSPVDWDTPGMIVDLSQVHAHPVALRLVMVGVTSWLTSLFTHRGADSGGRYHLVIDEAWSALADLFVARFIQHTWRLCRDYGVATCAIVHQMSDFGSQAADGTAAQKIAESLIGLSQTKVLFRTDPKNVPFTAEVVGLTDREAQLISRLARGRALWHVKDHAAVVQHLVAPDEWAFASSDHRMTIDYDGETGG